MRTAFIDIIPYSSYTLAKGLSLIFLICCVIQLGIVQLKNCIIQQVEFVEFLEPGMLDLLGSFKSESKMADITALEVSGAKIS